MSRGVYRRKKEGSLMSGGVYRQMSHVAWLMSCGVYRRKRVGPIGCQEEGGPDWLGLIGYIRKRVGLICWPDWLQKEEGGPDWLA